MPKQIDFPGVVAKLKDFYARRKRLPTYSELQSLFKYSSKGGVSLLTAHLVKRGILKRDAKGRLLPTPALEGGIKLLGTVQAGFPSPAEEELIDTLSLDEFLIKNPQASYLVKVTGDSMIDAGIMPEDLVIVERGRPPRHGDIVIAQVDGDWTMKYYEKRGAKVFLRAANKKYPTIEPKAELVVGGVVVANVRKYR
ncbi:MAG: translesion error-prone DNA polymerase V autoproteolytic subunit [Candidatus Omnitrophica bacterium]|nr:translesion error-prone DNA polymerase V autoproteolytic subunit [Candidatus Omnitrophota bacterium]